MQYFDKFLGKCGQNGPKLPNGKEPGCNPDHPHGHCCSANGWCGHGEDFCKCKGCKNYKH